MHNLLQQSADNAERFITTTVVSKCHCTKKMMLIIKDFSSKCDQIRRKLQEILNWKLHFWAVRVIWWSKVEKALSYSDSRIADHASNNPEELLTVLVVEMVCRHSGLGFVFSITLVSKLNYFVLFSLFQESICVVCEKIGCQFVLIFDNFPLNQGSYAFLGGPGPVQQTNILHIFWLMIIRLHSKISAIGL